MTTEIGASYLCDQVSLKDVARVCLFAASGSDAAALQTTAKLEGEHYIVNGTKVM